jgi:N-acetyl-gamma-glutamyl-phosphate reductase
MPRTGGAGNKIRVAVVGATGYTGVELIRLLSRHPGVQLTAVTSESYVDLSIAEVFPSLSGVVELACRKFDPEEVAKAADLVFLALPHKTAMGAAVQLLPWGKKVIDLSADFRLRDAGVYRHWYGVDHIAPDLLGEAVYALPEIYRRPLTAARLAAVPGCYPTAALLGLLPLVKRELIDPETIVIDAISGASGAGRKVELPLHFSELQENIRAYNVARHRHTPEIEQEVGLWLGREIAITFTPHLAPAIRGILATITATLVVSRETEELLAVYRDVYRREPFIRVLREGQFPETKQVYGSNFCDMGVAADGRTRRCIVVVAIDNLVKGASGQAVQAMNLMCGLDERTALEAAAPFP